MKTKINDGHYLELTDRLHIFTCNFEDYICNHPLIKENKDIKKVTDEVTMLLADLYQMATQKMYNNNETEQSPISQIVFRRHKKSKN